MPAVRCSHNGNDETWKRLTSVKRLIMNGRMPPSAWYRKCAGNSEEIIRKFFFCCFLRNVVFHNESYCAAVTSGKDVTPITPHKDEVRDVGWAMACQQPASRRDATKRCRTSPRLFSLQDKIMQLRFLSISHFLFLKKKRKTNSRELTIRELRCAERQLRNADNSVNLSKCCPEV